MAPLRPYVSWLWSNLNNHVCGYMWSAMSARMCARGLMEQAIQGTKDPVSQIRSAKERPKGKTLPCMSLEGEPYEASVFWGNGTCGYTAWIVSLKREGRRNKFSFLKFSFASVGIWNWAVVTETCHENRTFGHAGFTILNKCTLLGEVSEKGIRDAKLCRFT